MSKANPSAFGTPLLIANPAAGNNGKSLLQRLVDALRGAGVDPDVLITSASQNGRQLAREAADAGRKLIVAVGGDGTVHEVVNGLIDGATGTVRGDDPVLAVVCTGSGSDLVRTFGLDRRPEILVDHLLTDDVIELDVGRALVRDANGGDQIHLFLNVAQAGLGAQVVSTAAHLPRRLGRGRYGAAIALEAPRFRRRPTRVRVDSGSRTDPICNVVVANAQFFGGGLHVAPRALPTDGKFNVQTWGGHPVDMLSARAQLRRGTHLARDDVREWQSTKVTVTAARPLPVEADGEMLGTTPASFDVLERVLKFKL